MSNTMNTSALISTDVKTLPDRIVAHWRRFSCGLWRVPEGDISAAYCADTFPRIKVFTHEGRWFTNCGGHFSGVLSASADCYPLIPADEYCGPAPRRYTYEGCEGCYQRRVFKLGAKVVFAASEPKIEEYRQTFRVLYADGGWFARQQTYALFLTSQPAPKTANGIEAVRLELETDLTRLTKNEMVRLLDIPESHAEIHQLDLSL